jgi:hypothetical protein
LVAQLELFFLQTIFRKDGNTFTNKPLFLHAPIAKSVKYQNQMDEVARHGDASDVYRLDLGSGPIKFLADQLIG